MFPNGIIIFFRLLDANNNLACSVHPTGRDLRYPDHPKGHGGFWEVLDEHGKVLGLFEPDFVAAVVPMPVPEVPRAN